jgi:hypothetical protein
MTTSAFSNQSRATPASADLLDEMARDSGLGVSTDTADLLIPRLRVIQKTSSVIDSQNSDYLQNARVGDFLLGLVELRSASNGIEVIPAGMKRYWVEIAPDRTFVGRHDVLPADAKPVRDGNRPAHRRDNGNQLEDVREFALVCGGENFLLSCRGTSHTFARRWQTLLHSQLHPKTGRVLPSFASKFRLATVPARNLQGTWYGLKVELIGRVTDAAEYAAAKTLNKIVTSGGYTAEDPDEGNGADFGPDRQSSDDPFNGL